MDVAQALRLRGKAAVYANPGSLAMAGAGGKTTALFRLARELLGNPYPTVLATTTTHLANHQAQLADWHFVDGDDLSASLLGGGFPLGVCLLTGHATAEARWSALPESGLEALRSLAEDRRLPLLIEADGARMKPLKAPAAHEPAIPPFVNQAIILAGLSALGKPLDDHWVHRPEIFANLAGMQPGDPIDSEHLIRLLCHPQGGLKGIPSTARKVLLLNQAETPATRQAARRIASACLGAFDVALTAALQSQDPVHAVAEPVAGVILAAGESRRFGQPKQLLDWKGEPLVRHAANIALQAGCSPVQVVIGAHAEQVRQALEGLPVQIVENAAWQQGLSTSVKAAVQNLPPAAGAAIFLLVDQPQAPVALVEALIALHQETLASLTAPRCRGRRANPVLFDRSVFPQLMALQGDAGGRALFNQPEQLPIAWLDWEDPTLLLDIDTPEDYRRLQEGGS